jgi:hypothetical protein
MGSGCGGGMARGRSPEGSVSMCDSEVWNLSDAQSIVLEERNVRTARGGIIGSDSILMRLAAVNRAYSDCLCREGYTQQEPRWRTRASDAIAGLGRPTSGKALSITRTLTPTSRLSKCKRYFLVIHNSQLRII